MTDPSMNSVTLGVDFDGVKKYSKNYVTSPSVFTEIYNYTATVNGKVQICFYAYNINYKFGFFMPNLIYGLMFDNVTLNMVINGTALNTDSATSTETNTVTKNTTDSKTNTSSSIASTNNTNITNTTTTGNNENGSPTIP